MDDLLDFTAGSEQLGKPGEGNDMKLGLATAPALFASLEHPELQPMIKRKFSSAALQKSSVFVPAETDDTLRALDMVQNSRAFEMTRSLIKWHVDAACIELEKLPDNSSRESLMELTRRLMTRTK